MGFFKKVFGNAVEEVKKNLEDSKNEIVKNLEDKKNEMLKDLNAKKDEVLGNLGIKSLKSLESSTPRRNNGDNTRKQATDPKPRATAMSTNQDSGKKLWWVDNLELLYDGNKYALKYTGRERTTTKYIYDDVDLLSEYQVRLVQKQADGSIKYGVASTCLDFIYTDCEYTKVIFLDGADAILAIDEDGDEYAINRWGQIYALDVYKDKVINDMSED